MAALAAKQWDEALRGHAAPDGDEPGPSSELAAELAPYFAEHATIDVTPRARRPQPDASSSRRRSRGTFTARQRILDPAEEDEDWMIDAFVDARGDVGAGPIIELRGVRR